MEKSCEFYRNCLAEELAGELEIAEKAGLEAHLAACPACRQEQRNLAHLLKEVQMLEDEPVPRHFFVYPRTRSDFFRRLLPSASMRAAAIALVVFLALGIVLTASNLQVRLEEGVMTLSFGRPLPPSFDPHELQAQMLEVAGARMAETQREWAASAHQEWEKSISNLSEEQRQTLRTSLTGMEQRMRSYLEGRTLSMETKMQATVNDAYEALSSQHERDLVRLALRLEEALVRDQLERNQTEAVLAALVEVVSTNNER